MGCPYPASTLWAKESFWNAVILSDLTKFMYVWFSGFLLLFTESSIALERALLQSAAPVSNFYVLYHGCFLTPCIEVCSKHAGKMKKNRLTVRGNRCRVNRVLWTERRLVNNGDDVHGFSNLPDGFRVLVFAGKLISQYAKKNQELCGGYSINDLLPFVFKFSAVPLDAKPPTKVTVVISDYAFRRFRSICPLCGAKFDAIKS